MKKFILFILGAMLSGFMANAQGDSYIIQRGDVLDVTVMEHPEFSLGSIIVLPDGYVQYPALGSVKVAGMSSSQLTDSLTKALEKFVVNPMVSIFIRKIQNQQMNIFGYVNRPGQYQIYEKVDLFSALGLAGGLKSVKKVKSVLIIRANRKVEEFELQPFFSSDTTITAIPIPLVYAGDTIYVKEPKETNWAKLAFFTTALSLLITLGAYTNVF
jgi:polysaccharide export outer membrane protein